MYEHKYIFNIKFFNPQNKGLNFIMSNEDKLQSLIDRRKKADLGGGEKRIESQHKKGKLTARERLLEFFDENSFSEIDPFINHRSRDLGLEKNIIDGDSVITGYGKVNGRKVFAYSQDFTFC